MTAFLSRLATGTLFLTLLTAPVSEARIDPCEFGQAVPAGKAVAGTRPAKYRYVENGVEKTWSGQGRPPRFLAEQQAQGRQLDEFLIETLPCCNSNRRHLKRVA